MAMAVLRMLVCIFLVAHLAACLWCYMGASERGGVAGGDDNWLASLEKAGVTDQAEFSCE